MFKVLKIDFLREQTQGLKLKEIVNETPKEKIELADFRKLS